MNIKLQSIRENLDLFLSESCGKQTGKQHIHLATPEMLEIWAVAEQEAGEFEENPKIQRMFSVWWKVMNNWMFRTMWFYPLSHPWWPHHLFLSLYFYSWPLLAAWDWPQTRTVESEFFSAGICGKCAVWHGRCPEFDPNKNQAWKLIFFSHKALKTLKTKKCVWNQASSTRLKWIHDHVSGSVFEAALWVPAEAVGGAEERPEGIPRCHRRRHLLFGAAWNSSAEDKQHRPGVPSTLGVRAIPFHMHHLWE